MDECVLLLASLEGLCTREKMQLWGAVRDARLLVAMNAAEASAILGRDLQNLWPQSLEWSRRRELVQRVIESGMWTWAAIWQAEYPGLLKTINDPPFLLWVRGSMQSWNFLTVSVVGTRRPSESGRSLSSSIGADLAREHCCLVSGLAYGIDAAAHAACVERKGLSIAVLAGGADVVNPAGNRCLAQKILQHGGALVSEYWPGTVPRPWRFIARNRIIAGLSPALIVVEAPSESGALLTARYASEQSREIWVPPLAGNGERGEGTRKLLEQGAKPLTSVQRVINKYARLL